jgi:HTH-type transcriptional regulator, sugar sensing transcriptional regulator
MERRIVEQLARFGLTEKEAEAYLALLSFGTATARDVSRESGLNRSTSYVLLEALAKKGLASISQNDKNRFYTASPPERLIQSLESEARQAKEKLGDARNLLPELKSIYVGVGPKPKVTFYEGEQGIESVYEDTLRSSESIRAFASIESMHAALPHYFP